LLQTGNFVNLGRYARVAMHEIPRAAAGLPTSPTQQEVRPAADH
jgi:hypothetical protein